jgi:3-polyprenyl-4-hydroxybenzoate decarboxylase
LIRVEKKEAGDGARVIKTIGALTEEVTLPPWTIVVGPAADVADVDSAMFHWLANMSPERDRYLSVCGRRVAFDATPKMAGDEARGWPVRAWPPLIRMSGEVSERVAGRWGELGIGRKS